MIRFWNAMPELFVSFQSVKEFQCALQHVAKFELEQERMSIEGVCNLEVLHVPFSAL